MHGIRSGTVDERKPIKKKKRSFNAGKWNNGMDGTLTGKYKAKRKKKNKTARRSRSANHAKGKK